MSGLLKREEASGKEARKKAATQSELPMRTPIFICSVDSLLYKRPKHAMVHRRHCSRQQIRQD